jgi:hypothetical protein
MVSAVMHRHTASPSARLRFAVGSGITLAGAGLLAGEASTMLAGIVASEGVRVAALAGVAIGLGGLLLSYVRRINASELSRAGGDSVEVGQ